MLQGEIKASINSSIELGTFSMQTFYDAVRKLKRGAWMSKTDIKKAFRAVPLSEDQWELLTFLAGPGGDPYADTRLPFGLAKSPEIFCRLTDLVRLIMASMGYEDIVSYVDDFWLTASDEDKCNTALDALNSLLQKLGFQVEASKVERATRHITFLGLGLTTDAANDGTNVMEAHVPEDKMDNIIELASALSQPLRSYEVSQLQTLVGKLAFVTTVVRGARAHTMSLHHLLNQATAVGSRRFTMDYDGAADIRFWTTFGRVFNGKTPILAEPNLDPRFLSTDASDTGFGAFFPGHGIWADFTPASIKRAARLHPTGKLFSPALQAAAVEAYLLEAEDEWPRRDTAINVKKLFAFVWAAAIFGHRWRGRHVTLHVDNTAALARINSGSTRSANPAAAKMLRLLFWLSATHDFTVRATYINTQHNTLADILSRSGEKGAAYNRRRWPRGRALRRPRRRDHLHGALGLLATAQRRAPAGGGHQAYLGPVRVNWAGGRGRVVEHGRTDSHRNASQRAISALRLRLLFPLCPSNGRTRGVSAAADGPSCTTLGYMARRQLQR